MTSYTLLMNTTAGGLQWRYDFRQASDDMAITYARSQAHEMRTYRGLMGVTLFADAGTDKERLVGHVGLSNLTPILTTYFSDN